MDLSKSKIWQELKKHDIISVSDTQTLSKLLADGKGVEEIDLVIEDIQVFKAENDIEYRFFEFSESDPNIVIVTICVDEDAILRAYFVSDDPSPATRSNVLNVQECGWLFEPPDDEDNFIIDELAYRGQFDQADDTAKSGHVVYNQDGAMLTGTLDGDFASLQEWLADDGVNPRVILLEVGEADGFMTLYQGYDVGTNDLNVLRN
jgi:hypothetical protein